MCFPLVSRFLSEDGLIFSHFCVEIELGLKFTASASVHCTLYLRLTGNLDSLLKLHSVSHPAVILLCGSLH